MKSMSESAAPASVVVSVVSVRRRITVAVAAAAVFVSGGSHAWGAAPQGGGGGAGVSPAGGGSGGGPGQAGSAGTSYVGPDLGGAGGAAGANGSLGSPTGINGVMGAADPIDAGGAGGGGSGGSGVVTSGTQNIAGSVTGGNGGNGSGGAVIGGGGGGGVGGYGVAALGAALQLTLDATVKAGNGGSGGTGGGGGGGGGGGHGLYFDTTGSGVVFNGGSITAGKGGNGGRASLTARFGGSGGNGGAGVDGVGLNLQIGSGSITGGNGGNGGEAAPYGGSGNGGAGGAGVSGSNLTLRMTSGSITGGTGGTAGPAGLDSTTGVAGAAGAGIAGTDLTLRLDGGTVAGGGAANAITFAGGTNTLTRNGGTLTGSIGVAGTLTLLQTTAAGATGDITYANTITGSGALIVSADNGRVVTLSGANTYTGGTTLSAGTLSVSSDAILGAASGGLAFNGGTLRITGAAYASTARAIRWGTNGGGFDIADANATFSVSQNLANGGGLTKFGGGMLVLAGSGDNAYLASTVNAGTLVLAKASTESVHSVTALTINAGGTARLAGGGGDQIYDASSVTLNGGTLDLNGRSETIAGLSGAAGSVVTNTAAGAAVLNVGGTGNGTYAGTLADGTGAVALVKSGAGTLALTGSNTFTGGIAINGGTLSVSSNANLGAAGNAISFDGNSRLRITGTAFSTLSRNLTTVAGGIDVEDASHTVTLTGVVSGSGYFVKAGPGTLVVTRENTNVGGTAIDAGTLRLGDGTNVAALAGSGDAGTGAIVTAGATLDVRANARVTGSATLVNSPNTDAPGGRGVVVNGSGVVLNGGVIRGGAGAYNGIYGTDGGVAVAFTGAGGSLTNSGTITGGNAGDGAIGPGKGGNAVSFAGGGTLLNSGVVNAGPGIRASGLPGFPTSPDGFAVLVSGAAGTLVNQSSGVINGNVRFGNFANSVTLETGSRIDGTLDLGTSAAASLTLTGDGSRLYSSAVTGATSFNGSLAKTGNGSWTLDRTFTYAGTTAIQAGTLSVSSDANLGAAASPITLDGNGRLQITGTAFNTLTRNVSTTAGGIDVADANNTVTASGVIGGSGYFVKSGPGTLVLTGNNTYHNTAIDAGTLRVSSDANLGTAAASVQIGSLATLQASGTFEMDRPLRLYSGGGTVVVDAGQTLTQRGSVFDDGKLVKSGPGMLKLTGDTTYTGGTSVVAGTLAAGRLRGSTTIEQAGTLTPGNGVGVLSIYERLAFQPGATLLEEFDGASTLSGPGLDYDFIDGLIGSSLDLSQLGVEPGQQASIVLSNVSDDRLLQGSISLGKFDDGIALPAGFSGSDLTRLFNVTGDIGGTPSIVFDGFYLSLTVTVPEPGGIALLGLGGIALVRRRRR